MNEQGNGHFGDESLQSVTCTGTDRENNQETEHVQNINQCNPQNGPNKQQYKTLKKPRPREDRQSMVSSPFTSFGQQTERVYSYNPGACTGQLNTDN